MALIKSLPRKMGFEHYLELLGTLLPLYEEVATSRVFEDGKTIVYVILILVDRISNHIV